jgi:hypothetical protein
MVAPGGHACPRCGSSLRWIAESSAWACDPCRITYPAQGTPVVAPAAPIAAAPRSRRALAPKQKILVVAGSVAGVALIGITLVLLMGGHKGSGKATPEELFDAALDRATAGDGDGLFALSGMQQMFDSVMDCSEQPSSSLGDKHRDVRAELFDEQRDQLTRHLDRWKGLTVTITSVEPKGEPDEQRAGVSMGGCTARTDITTQQFRVKAKVKGKDGGENDAELRFTAAQVNGLWYLDDMPSPPGSLSRLREIKDRMCACSDRTCAEAAQKELEEYGKTMADSGATSADDSAEQTRVINELTDCEVKAMSGGSPY